ncbi:metal-dependent hydrolase [Actinosynnema sp. NPDC023587]|uniref:metal-dependent hydrolase n=1 Tax=Actinosynnema sp. NPDC023587 TaxID=3154695 RepID=UPI0033CF2BED
MLGRTHAATGWCAGLALAPLLGAHTLAQAVVVATVTAGSALIPDLDHPVSRASRLIAPVTGLLSTAVRWTSGAVYQLTKGPADEDVAGVHRHLTHTVVFAALLGWWTTWWVSVTGPWAAVTALAIAVLLAVDALGDWLVLVVIGVALLWVGRGDPLAELAGITEWLGIAIGVGCVVHCLGDALTLSGCPFLWPIPIAGETWYELRPPRLLRFRTGGGFELWVVWPLCVAGGVLLLPGAWPLVVGLTGG